MAKGCNNYEEARKLRLEENKKRFEDLGISKISKKLTKIKSPAKKSPIRFLKPNSKKTNGVVEPRRSSRARNSVSSYREEFSMDLPHRSSYIRKRSRSSSSSWESYIARPLEEIKEATREERIRALEAAEKLQNNLQSSNPSFVKSMVRSHVYSCFWLGLPSRFCEEHLPKTVYNMVLEDEDGSETDAVYIGNRSGLSGGWRGFALHHKLDDGDALVFELVEPARFKIYIVRAFPKSDEEEENDTLVEEENVHKSKATKESKGSGNRQSESKKTKRQKQAIVCETKESESSKESMPESSINKDSKLKRVNPKRRTKSFQKNVQKKSKLPTTPDSESKEEAKVETLKLETTIRKTRSSQKKMQKISEVPTTPDSEPKEEAKIESLKPKAAIVKTRSSQRKMEKMSEVPTTPDSQPKEEAKIESLKPKAAIAKTRSSQRKRQKISEVPTTPDNEPKEEAKVETPKPNAAIAKTRSSQRKMQKTSEVPTTSKGEALVETMKPKAATKLSKKKKKSEEGNACEIGDSGNTKQLLEDNVVKIIEVNPSEKKEVIEDADIELKKVERDEKASKCDSQKPRKKPTQRFFRKRA